MTRGGRTISVNVHDELAGLGQRLRDIRLHRELSQRGVEKLTDGALSVAGVSRIESGDRRDPQASTLLALAMAYDCDIKLTRKGTVVIMGTGLNGVGSGAPKEES